MRRTSFPGAAIKRINKISSGLWTPTSANDSALKQARKAKKFLTPLITSFFRNQGASNYLNGARDLQPQLSGSNRDSAAATYAAAAPAYGIFLILYEQVSRIKVCELNSR